MSEERIKEVLQKEVKIPDIVEQKIQETYGQLGQEMTQKDKKIVSLGKRKNRTILRITVTAACIGIVLIGTNWNRVYSFAKSLFVNDKVYVGNTKLELPEMKYLRVKWPKAKDEIDRSSSTNYYTDLEEVEQEMNIHFLKNKYEKSHGQKKSVSLVLPYGDEKIASDENSTDYILGEDNDIGDDKIKEKEKQSLASDGSVSVFVPSYIICGKEGKDYTLDEDGQALCIGNPGTWFYSMDLEICFYGERNNQKQKCSYEEEFSTDLLRRKYTSKRIGTYYILADKYTDDKEKKCYYQAVFVYKNIRYTLSGKCSMNQLCDAVENFYE